MNSFFALTREAIDTSVYRGRLLTHAAGAYNSFEGWIRDLNEGQSVLRLEYKSYDLLADKQGAIIIEEALAKFDILAAGVVHRVGKLELGDMAVWVGVVAGHREASFEACRYLIDEVKIRVPIWKKEYYESGPSGWLEPGLNPRNEP